ncbi:hypothetical protein GCM10027299_47380 [Larkinella ripae]
MKTTLINQKTALLDRLYRRIQQQPTTGDVSLLAGQMGFALLEAYAQRYFGETDDSRIWERISTSLAAVQNGALLPSFAGGMAGVAWGFLHLCNRNLLQTDGLDAQDIVADLDEPLFELAMEQLRKGNFDYLHGGLSAALYFLERPASPVLTHYLEQMVQALSDTAVRFSNGDITWSFDDLGRRASDEPAIYNPGLSHGTASIVAILCLLYERGYARRRAAELIRGTLQWTWNHRNRSGQSVFPTVVHENRQDQNSRLGWCYGDLGIAHTFWRAGRLLNHSGWQALAEETMLRAAQRRNRAEAHIYDAGLCHGSAGVAYLFRRFAQHNPHPLLTETADYWMQQTLLQATPDGHETAFLLGQGASEVNLGLLDGEGSVALVLLAELGVPAGWDRFLLLS